MASAALGQRGPHRRLGQHQARRSGGAHHKIHIGQWQVGEVGRDGTVQRGQPLRPLGAPVRHEQRASRARGARRGSAGPGQGGQCQTAQRTGADDKGRTSGEPTGDQVQCGGDDAAPGPVDAGLGVHPLADPQRLLHQLVQVPAGGLVLGSQAVRVPQLAQDLGLADHHRVEPGGHPQRVGRRVDVEVDVQVRGQQADVQPGPLGEHRTDVGQATVEGGDGGVDLDPVAGGEHDGLVDVRLGHEAGQELRGLVPRHGEPLEQLNRGGVVGQADYEQVHRGTPG